VNDTASLHWKTGSSEPAHESSVSKIQSSISAQENIHALQSSASELGWSKSLRHRPYEDVQALITGTLFSAFGVVMFSNAGLVTGGTAGLVFLIHYSTGWNFGLIFFLINLPFYALAWKRMEKSFMLKTFIHGYGHAYFVSS